MRKPDFVTQRLSEADRILIRPSVRIIGIWPRIKAGPDDEVQAVRLDRQHMTWRREAEDSLLKGDAWRKIPVLLLASLQHVIQAFKLRRTTPKLLGPEGPSAVPVLHTHSEGLHRSKLSLSQRLSKT